MSGVSTPTMSRNHEEILDVSLPAKPKNVGTQSVICISPLYPVIFRSGLLMNEAPRIPPSYMVSLEPFNGKFEFHGPPPLSVVTRLFQPKIFSPNCLT